MDQSLPPQEILRTATRAIRDRLWLVVLCTVLVPLVALVAGVFDQPVRAKVLLTYTDPAPALAPLGVPVPPVPNRTTLLAPRVINGIAGALEEKPSSLKSRLDVVERPTAKEYELIAEGPDEASARRLAETWANVVIDSRNADLASSFVVAERALRDVIRKANGSERQPLLDRLTALRNTARSVRPDVSRNSAAEIDAGFPRWGLVLLALAAGLGIGICLALLIALGDDRVRTVAAASGLLRAPPLFPDPVRIGPDDDPSRGAEIALRLVDAAGGVAPRAVLWVPGHDRVAYDSLAQEVAGAFADVVGKRGEVLRLVDEKRTPAEVRAWLRQAPEDGAPTLIVGTPDGLSDGLTLLLQRDASLIVVVAELGTASSSSLSLTQSRLVSSPGIARLLVVESADGDGRRFGLRRPRHGQKTEDDPGDQTDAQVGPGEESKDGQTGTQRAQVDLEDARS
jgi:hypothetical protein